MDTEEMVGAYYVDADGTLLSMAEPLPFRANGDGWALAIVTKPGVTRDGLANVLRRIASALYLSDGLFVADLASEMVCEVSPSGKSVLRPLGG